MSESSEYPKPIDSLSGDELARGVETSEDQNASTHNGSDQSPPSGPDIKRGSQEDFPGKFGLGGFFEPSDPDPLD